MMLLVIHVLVAIGSLALTTLAYFRLSYRALNASYAFVGVTLITGTILALIGTRSLVHSCMTGLLYLGIASFGLVLARRQFDRPSK